MSKKSNESKPGLLTKERSPFAEWTDTSDLTFEQVQASASIDTQKFLEDARESNTHALATQRLRNPFREQEPGVAPSGISLQKSLDALPTPFLVLDLRGEVQLANRAWEALVPGGLGQPYLQLCRAMLTLPTLLSLAKGLRSVTAAKRDVFLLCIPPQEDSPLAEIRISRSEHGQAFCLLVEHRMRQSPPLSQAPTRQVKPTSTAASAAFKPDSAMGLCASLDKAAAQIQAVLSACAEPSITSGIGPFRLHLEDALRDLERAQESARRLAEREGKDNADMTRSTEESEKGKGPDEGCS